ncbi:MAG: carboxypeptidase M32 [Alphaproteobacteria bacterium]|nr:carboxypeptidase M32 [Alphaproteobacteria bacterium]
MSAYAKLEERFGKIAAVGQAAAILHWDAAVMLPEGASAGRGEQLAALEGITHDWLSDARVGEWLAAAEAEKLDAWKTANVREMGRKYKHATAVPGALKEKLVKCSTEAEMRWRSARKENDFAGFAPHLEQLLALVREIAQIKAEAFGVGAYEALLDEYDPGRKVAEIDAAFAPLEKELPGLIEAACERTKALAASLPMVSIPVERQKALGKRLMKAIGFDFQHGRLDESAHPFCGGVADDIRITTRYDEADFSRALMGVIHETGHAMYERGLPGAWSRQPVGEARGMAFHESQSLLMEMQVCRSREFFSFLAPLLGEVFSVRGNAWEAEALYRGYTRVERSFIRVDADEVTYPAHVLLRYRLEQKMIAGDLKVRDLPGAWAEGMKSLLGIVPPDDAKGCLQDIHWPGGAFGYFPTYTLGAMIAAQLYAAAKKAQPEIPGEIAKGNFAPLLTWLREKVHGKASLLGQGELLKEATGQALDAGVYLAHLRKRYVES